jgi:hypothetical protein
MAETTYPILHPKRPERVRENDVKEGPFTAFQIKPTAVGFEFSCLSSFGFLLCVSSKAATGLWQRN